MCSITLIATMHKERGFCNSNELYKIIEQIEPDIIFEELSPTASPIIYNDLRYDTLETKTIKLFLQKHHVHHLPVDLDANQLVNKHLKNEIEEMFDIFDNSNEYINLSIKRDLLSERQGFPFLNSSQCRDLMKHIRFLEEAILKMVNNEKLSHTYKCWLDIHERRENEMIRNMYNSLNAYDCKKGLFLVGAEHRQSIIDKLPTFKADNQLDVRWVFNHFK